MKWDIMTKASLTFLQRGAALTDKYQKKAARLLLRIFYIENIYYHPWIFRIRLDFQNKRVHVSH